MSIVTLTSGGLDSTLVAYLAAEASVKQHPLFIDYGQRSRNRELAALKRAFERLALPQPVVVNLAGFGNLIRSGLTDPSLHIVDDAFTPGRNMLFLLVAAAYAYQMGADAVSIGLLNEDTSLFPDQTKTFLREAAAMITLCLGRRIDILAPLADFHKVDVVALAKAKGIDGTYSCHTGQKVPCGQCIACKEYDYEGG